MTHDTSNRPEWLEQLERDEKYQLEEAAADLAVEVSGILHRAIRARTDMDQQKLAELLNVTPGRVSQVLNSDGNLHIATVAKYLRALGYTLNLEPEPVTDEAPPLKRARRGGNRERKVTDQTFQVFQAPFIDQDGGSTALVFTLSSAASAHTGFVGDLTHKGCLIDGALQAVPKTHGSDTGSIHFTVTPAEPHLPRNSREMVGR